MQGCLGPCRADYGYVGLCRAMYGIIKVLETILSSSLAITGTSTLDKGLIFSFLYDRGQVLYIDIACSRLRDSRAR